LKPGCRVRDKLEWLNDWTGIIAKVEELKVPRELDSELCGCGEQSGFDLNHERTEQS